VPCPVFEKKVGVLRTSNTGKLLGVAGLSPSELSALRTPAFGNHSKQRLTRPRSGLVHLVS